MRFRNVKNKEMILNDSSLFISNPFDFKGRWSSLFNNDNEIYLEIGSGKCGFIYQQALKNPNINFIGIERIDSVLAHGINQIDKELDNLKFINVDALKLNDIFLKEISLIFLNFSDPWPKARHSKRRLTSDVFLNIYEDVFVDEKCIELKTDNKGLFEYSLVKLSEHKYIFVDVCLDLQSDDNNDNIMTEYESKFVMKGLPIYKLKALKKEVSYEK